MLELWELRSRQDCRFSTFSWRTRLALHHKGLPVEILATFDTWRKIRTSDGTIGWVHQGMLSGRRSVLVTGGVRPLRHDPKTDGGIIAQLEPGVVARISRCDPAWCEVKTHGYRGWIARSEIWGLEASEIIQ